MKTTMPKQSNITRKWFHINGDNRVLGRLASQISLILQGKNKPNYAPHIDNGDFVIVTNVEKIRLTGNKALQKNYYHHTGYPGGLRETSYEEMLERKPDEVLRKAVWGMLPKNKLGKKVLKKLKIYSGSDHPHAAQQPVDLDPLKKMKNKKKS